MKTVEFLKQNGVDVDKSLELFGDMETYNQTLPEFLNGGKEKVPQLKNFKEVADMANYAIVVHSLKSDARYFGFMVLGEKAYQHEMESKASNSDFVYQDFDNLMMEVNKAVNIANEYLETGVSTPVIETPKAVGTKDQKILVVDDSAVIISFVEKIFANEYEVVAAGDGEQALNIIKEDPGKIKAMLLDIFMPNVNGFGVLEYFKNNNLFEKVPVSIITGAYTKEVIDIVRQYDVVDVLAKPFNEKNVKEVVERTIHRGEEVI